MANRCLLLREESASQTSFPASLCPFSHRHGFSGARSARLGNVDEKVSRRRKFELSRARARLPHGELRCILNLWWWPPVLHVDSIRKRVSVPDPTLTSSRWIPLAAEFSRLLRRRYSFKRLVFPVGTRQPQQRHEKRLINKLIRFLPTPRRTPSVLSISFFFSRKPPVPVLPLTTTGHTVVDPSRLPETRHPDSNPTHVSLAR